MSPVSNGGTEQAMPPHVAYELLMERLACPNQDAPFHTSLGCSYCIQTKPMVEAVRILWDELQKEGMRACDEAMEPPYDTTGPSTWETVMPDGSL